MNTPATAQGNDPSEDVVARLAAGGVLNMGYRADAPPFSWVEEGQPPAGLAVLLCQRAADALVEAAGSRPDKVNWVGVDSRTRFEFLENGKIDLLCGPTSQTLSRRELFDFSIPYFVDGAGMVFRRGGAERIEDLQHAPVGVLRGTTTAKLLASRLDFLGVDADIKLFKRHDLGLQALANGQIEAYAADHSILMYQLGALMPTTPLVVSPDRFSFEPYALAMRRGQTKMRLVVDRALSKIYADGEIFDLIEQTMGDVELNPLNIAVYGVVALPE